MAYRCLVLLLRRHCHPPCKLIRECLSFLLAQALAKFQSSQKVSTKSGIEQEDALLSESAALETSLNLHILELENELRQNRHELERVTMERDRMLQENSDIGRDKSDTEAERMRLKAEVKELKFRETRMLTDYSELEEENISLQKQVSSLRSSQVEFEGAKHEIRRLAEEIELLHSQVEELANLKKIAEKQMEEALEALQVGLINKLISLNLPLNPFSLPLPGRTRSQVRDEEGPGRTHQPRVHLQHQQLGVQHSRGNGRGGESAQ